MKSSIALSLALLMTLVMFPASAQESSKNNTVITVHFFWSEGCPHCRKEKTFLKALENKYEWLAVNYLEVSEGDNAKLFYEMASDCGEIVRGVPGTFICGNLIAGYRDDSTTGREIEEKVLSCYNRTLESVETCEEQPNGPVEFELPIFGTVSAAAMSLPVLTVIIGFLDGFNPCAFFVLFFLLSLLIHAKSRAKMLLIGGIFVFFSGLIYFLFMAAWLNLFLMMENIDYITTIAGLVALAIAAINIKDFFWFKKGISLTIPDTAKPKLFTRMRELMKSSSFGSLVVSTVVLAIAANTYELLCTAGFPMVYTRLLTLRNLSNIEYYMYLAFYNIVYVIPLFAIVLLFTATLGARQLTEKEGRALKLLAGVMMLCLGLVLVFSPAALSNLETAAGILVAAIAITALTLFLDSARKEKWHRK
jgi:thiol-disulfide isomerase/thioredoxin